MRPLAWLAVLGLLILWWVLPAGDTAAVAVQRIGVLFRAPIEGGGRSLADQMLDHATVATDAASVGAGGLPVKSLALGGVRMTIPGIGIEDLTIHGRARRAVIAALRQAASERGTRLEIRGELSAGEGALSVLLAQHDGRLSARVRGAALVNIGASIPSPASNRRALLPALTAIGLVIVWRRPLVALFAGLGLGAVLLLAADPAAPGAGWDRFPGQFGLLLFDELNSKSAWKPMVTLIALMSTWAITARNGGLGGWTAWLSEHARSARRAQLVTWLCAVGAFFEAPGKNIALGWLLRTMAVRARLSAEKFAWLLDSTGTAVLGLCVISPWSGYAFGLAAAQAERAQDAGDWWLETLPWRSFCWLSLALGPLVALSGRDFGSMLRAERRAREGLGANARSARRVFAAPEPDPRTTPQAWRALAPFAVFALALLAQGLRDGGVFSGGFALFSRASWLELARAMTHADASMVAALAALVVALALSSVAGAERGVPVALLRGVRAAARPCLLVFAAWALEFVSSRLGAGEVLAGALSDRVAPQTLPAILFALGAGASFCFGSSLAALALLVPLAVGFSAGETGGFLGEPATLSVISLAAVLEGSLAGALLSPLASSSLSASIGAGADHADHVRTQAPYALLSMIGVLIFGFLAAGLFSLGPWAALALVALVHALVFAWLSRSSERRAT